jgi:hypothetical protein
MLMLSMGSIWTATRKARAIGVSCLVLPPPLSHRPGRNSSPGAGPWAAAPDRVEMKPRAAGA